MLPQSIPASCDNKGDTWGRERDVGSVSTAKRGRTWAAASSLHHLVGLPGWAAFITSAQMNLSAWASLHFACVKEVSD